ncbi:hypothetical protein AMECASPLE_003455 [Ameca splendens]|uniref:U-box domain-containing protein n=1 Tax=Ameca splendens TaxID=208324 RepID=A0ABV1A5B4_9TELE
MSGGLEMVMKKLRLNHNGHLVRVAILGQVRTHAIGLFNLFDGYSYEQESIESWIRGKNKTSPMTNVPLKTTLVTPNRSLKRAITRWKSSQ